MWCITKDFKSTQSLGHLVGSRLVSLPLFSFGANDYPAIKKKYDVVIVTSQHVVSFVKEWPLAASWIAVGPSTAKTLSSQNIEAQLPKDFSIQGIASHFKYFLKGQSLLILTGTPVPHDYNIIFSMCHSVNVCCVYQRIKRDVLSLNEPMSNIKGWVITSLASAKYLLELHSKYQFNFQKDATIIVCSDPCLLWLNQNGYMNVYRAKSPLLEDIAKKIREITHEIL